MKSNITNVCIFVLLYSSLFYFVVVVVLQYTHILWFAFDSLPLSVLTSAFPGVPDCRLAEITGRLYASHCLKSQQFLSRSRLNLLADPKTY